MDYKDNTSIVNLANAGYKQMARIHIDALRQLESNPHLTIHDRKTIHAARLATMHTGKLFNMLSYLLSTNGNSVPEKIESYNIESMMTELLSEFERMASAYIQVSINFTSRLKNTEIISLSKINFEFIMINLLYCCIKPLSNNQPEPVKITVSVTETRDHIVFHIYDNSKNFNPDQVDAYSPTPPYTFDRDRDNSAAHLIALSVCVAQKSAEDMKGKMSFSSLKQSNRYDIYLPKCMDTPLDSLSSPVNFSPTYWYYMEVLSDIGVYRLLNNADECNIDILEGVREL